MDLPAWRRGKAHGVHAEAAQHVVDRHACFLMSIVQHRQHGSRPADLVVADESHSVQPGTSAWADFGRKPA